MTAPLATLAQTLLTTTRCPARERAPGALLALFAALSLLLPAQLALAQSKTWNGSVSSDWHTASNWTPAGVPGAADAVLIPAGAGSVSLATSAATVQSLTLARPLTVNRPLSAAVLSVGSTLTFTGGSGGLNGASLAFTAGGALSFTGGTCDTVLFENVTINGDLPSYTGGMRWKNVTLNGTMTMQAGSILSLEGSQTLTGTIVGAGLSNNPAYIVPRTSDTTITIGAGTTIRGQGIQFNSGVCFGTSGVTLINLGTINGEVAAHPIRVGLPLTNTTGLLAGRVQLEASITNSTLSNGSAAALSFTGGTCDTVLFENVTINGDLPSYTGGMRWKNVTLNGTMTMQAGSILSLEGSQTLTGTIVGAGLSNNPAYIVPRTSDTTITIGAGTTIRGQGIQFNSGVCFGTSGVTLINLGTINGEVAAHPIRVGLPLTNTTGNLAGTVRVEQGLNLSGGTWTHSTGTLVLGGSVTNGTLNLATGGTLNIGSLSANVNGVTINSNGGTWVFGNSGCGSVLFENVTINGDIPGYTSTAMRWKNVTLNGTMTMQAGSVLSLEGSQTLTGTIVGNATGSNFASIVPWTNNSTITIGAGATIRGQGIQFNSGVCFGTSGVTLTNLGTINGEVAGNPIIISLPLTNTTGTLAGRVRVNNGFELGGGAWTHSTGTLELSSQTTLRSGTLNLTGGSLAFTNNSCGSVLFENVTINGDIPGYTSNAMRWKNVTLNGTMTMQAGSVLSLDGSQTLTGTIVGNATVGNLAYIVPWTNNSTITIGAGATIRGQGIQFNSGVCFGTSGVTLTNLGTINGEVAANPISISLPLTNTAGNLAGTVRVEQGLNLSGGTWTHSTGTLDLTSSSSIRNGTLNLTGGTLAFSNSSCGSVLFENVTINGDIPGYTSTAMRWKNVTLNGTMTMGNNSVLNLDGSQTLTGTIVGAANGNNLAYIAAWGANNSTITIGAGTTIRGQGIQLLASYCSGGSGSTLTNLGTINGQTAGNPIIVSQSLPFTNFGVITGFVNTPVFTPPADWTVAGPTQPAIVTAPRPDPGSFGTQTLTYTDLFVAPGVPFTLGSGETLNLDNGNGTLYIAPGAVFTGNGNINGNVVNQGLLIIPITRAGLIFNRVQGGIVQVVVPPTQTVVNYPSGGGSWVWPRGTYTSLGGFGFGRRIVYGGGGGGSPPPPRRHFVPSPITVQGTVAWDGRLDVSGSYAQTESAFLRLFIAGTAQGETYSMLAVGQGASLDGTIQVVLEPELFGYLPTQGDTFDMIEATGGITLPPDGLTGINVQTLMTAAGAAQLGLNYPAFNSGFAGDPNALVLLPSNLFDLSLVNSGTTIRMTMASSIDCPRPLTSGNLSTCPGGTASVTVSPIGVGPFTYQWRYRATEQAAPVSIVNGPRISGATGPTLTITSVTSADGGFYDCVVTPAAGSLSCPSSASALARVFIGCDNPSNVASPGQGATCDDELTADDIIVFIGWFFNADTRADVAGSGQVPTPDGQFTADDIIVFVNRFFAGC